MEAEAESIADYFEQHNKDPRVTVGAFDASKVSKFDATFGGMAYKAHACLGCHVIEENGKLIGGPQSASLVAAGQRYDKDWLFRFGQNPQDFTPHSGEFLADATEPQLRAVIGFLWCRASRTSSITSPGRAQEFGTASVDRGKVIYKQYCSQCHGATGKGDGPAASGLDPKPAIHANIPFDKVPIDYLYNVINHGGAAMGKSPNMPYWNLTIGQQGVADVMAYLKATFKGGPEVAQAAVGSGGGPTGVCPQPRKTTHAPQENFSRRLIRCQLRRHDPSRESAVPADRAAGGLRYVPWGQGQRTGVHGRGADSTSPKLYLWLDDEGHS